MREAQTGIIDFMENFNFTLPIQVRYGDLDPQWHVNNARFLTYIEQARFAYLMELGLFDGKSYLDLPFIVADMHIAYLAPITLLQKVVVGVRVTRLGGKSMKFEYRIEDQESGQALATVENIMVAYDYHNLKTIPIPENVRGAIAAYEGIPAYPTDK